MKTVLADGDRAVTRLHLNVRGRVQGVGFRPFVHRQAVALGLSGFVMNTPEGVTVEVEGPSAEVASFADVVARAPPPNAVVADVATCPLVPHGRDIGFEIRISETVDVSAENSASAGLASIPLDLASCPACLAEIADPASRRYRYPFTTCTDCGPRYTIVESLPFDRARTSMRHFPMCAACQAEYDDPAARRFHAETIACPACGPQLTLRDRDGRARATHEAALGQTADLLRSGAIVAVKGLGGFLLIVDGRNEAAVARLRARKRRPDKPFAVMFPDMEAIAAVAEIDITEAALLADTARPIVLIARVTEARSPSIAPCVAPSSRLLGAMLPYTPLYHILLKDLGFPVVATSGNVSGEPLAIDNDDPRLPALADALLVHDRPILRPVDDSVARIVAGRPMLIRRARGYAPSPIPTAPLPPGILAVGGHLKSTVALTTAAGIVLSPHIGDLDCDGAEHAFVRAVAGLRTLAVTGVRGAVTDHHPDYASTRFAHSLGIPTIAVQHHVAHIAAVIAEHRLALPVLGVAWDGTGLGTDGTIWGGEFIRIDETGWTRVAHLAPMRLPGGDAAAREPRRAAVAALHATFGADWSAMTDLAPVAAFTEGERRTLSAMLERGINAPITTSAGRLFDAVAALISLIEKTTFEGQAAAALESIAADAHAAAPYRFDLHTPSGNAPLELDWRPAIAAIVGDVRARIPASQIAFAFHAGMALAIAETVERLGDTTIALAGGCFQNKRLTEAAIAELRGAGRAVHWPEAVPANDGGLALGQAWWAGTTLAAS